MADEDRETALEPLHSTDENQTQHSHRSPVCNRICMCTLDGVALFCIITTAVIFFWRGTWYIMDNIVNPRNYEASGWLSFVLGFLIIIVMHMWQTTFKRIVGKSNRVLWNIASRVHTYILAFGCVNQWRGVWHVWDNYTGDGLNSGLISTFTALAILWASRSSRNILRPPNSLLFDCNHKFTILTRFRVEISSDIYLYLLDLIFTVIVLGSAVVSYWRGMWTCIDNVLFPADTEFSGWASLGIGYGIVFTSYLLQFIAAEISCRLGKYSRIAFEDFFLSIVAFGILNIWRGVWYLSDVYIISDKVWASGWTTHCI
uniref:Uncharacterized protein LOC102803953 n=1 Tax=Saccoglossus kowalevskii TaxID=10224 RepID=A0ABM0M1N9_SACKO